MRGDEAEAGPAKGGGVGGEEADEEQDADADGGVEEGAPEEVEVLEVGGADLAHAAGEKGVADGGGEGDGQEDEVLGGFEAVFGQGVSGGVRCARVQRTGYKVRNEPMSQEESGMLPCRMTCTEVLTKAV